MLSSLFKSLPHNVAIIAILFIVAVALAINYVHDVQTFKRARKEMTKQQIPPKFPAYIPYLGTLFQLLLGTTDFLQHVTSHAGQLTSTRLAIAPHCDIYLFQDRDTIKEIWRKSATMCAGKVHVFACKYMFGMSQKTLSLYSADDSGPFPKPYPGSQVLPENRVHRLLSNGIDKALTGSGFDPKLQRFKKILASHIHQQLGSTDNEYFEIDDFHKFMHHTVGLSIITTIFGPNLTRLNPTFMDDLFEFEHWFPWLAKGVPSFIIPKAYAVRRRLHSHFKRWYAYAREHYTESSIGPDRDEDPFWGSEWMRQRQEALQKLGDEDSLAAGDLGVAWASLSNIVAASALMLVHVSQDETLTDRVRADVTSKVPHGPLVDANPKELSNSTLLSSIYAETLRLYVHTLTIISSPLENVSLGQYWLPKGALGLVNSHMAHTDNDFWNTRDGLHPLDSFWAERFIIDPADPSSGPSKFTSREMRCEQQENEKPFFSLKGLDASWIPYGGGHLVCPGRFLAKNVMIFTTAIFNRDFDVKVLTKEFDFTWRNYGFGISMPKRPIVVQMRRRR